ncbi:hypothetical protein V5051_25700, partial [Phytobacter diazotrophicus]
GYRQTNQKTDTGKTLTRWPVFVDHFNVHGCEALPMEVFGMNTTEYLLRKQKKMAHYDKEYGPGRWWQWDAAADPDGSSVPDFPSRN